MQLKDKNGKRYYILKGFEANNNNLVTDGPELEWEIESQTQQLFDFIYCQIPYCVAKRLATKMKDEFLKNPLTN